MESSFVKKAIGTEEFQNSDELLIMDFIRDAVLAKLRGDWAKESKGGNTILFNDCVPPHRITRKEDKPNAVSFNGVCEVLEELAQQLQLRLPNHQLKAELARLESNRSKTGLV